MSSQRVFLKLVLQTLWHKSEKTVIELMPEFLVKKCVYCILFPLMNNINQTLVSWLAASRRPSKKGSTV